MKFMKSFAIVLLIQTGLSFTAAAQKQFKALLVTTTRGWHHESLHYGAVALKEMATKNYFDITLFEDPNSFTDKNLQQYQVVIFLNTTGDILTPLNRK